MAANEQLRVKVIGYADSDDRERAALAGELERLLRQTDATEISRPAGEAPAGAKGGAVEWAQLIITGIGALPALITAIHSWLARQPGAQVTVEIDGDNLTLGDASPSERKELIDVWMARHER
jgi:hypothetical protein